MKGKEKCQNEGRGAQYLWNRGSLETEAEDRLLALSLSMVARAIRAQEGTGGSMSARSGVVKLSPWLGVVDHSFCLRTETTQDTGKSEGDIFWTLEGWRFGCCH
jgi:hypothetical protein